jgi:hypothetical protein
VKRKNHLVPDQSLAVLKVLATFAAEKRNKRAVKAVEYMLAHPLSWEEIDKQIARNAEHLTADEIRRREQAMIAFYRLLEDKKSPCS